MYPVDTDVISRARKRTRANAGVRRSFRNAATQGIPLFLSAVTIGELHRAKPFMLLELAAPPQSPRAEFDRP